MHYQRYNSFRACNSGKKVDIVSIIVTVSFVLVL